MSEQPSVAGTVTANVDSVRRIVEQGFNVGDLSVGDLCAPTFVNNVCAYGVPMGPDGLTGHIRMIRQAYPGIRIDVHDLIAAGNEVCVRWVSRGAAEGSYMGNSAGGYTFRTSQIAFYRFADGRLAEWTGTYDPLAMGQPAQDDGTPSPPDNVWQIDPAPTQPLASAADLEMLLSDVTQVTPGGLSLSADLRLSVHRRPDAVGPAAMQHHRDELRAAFGPHVATVSHVVSSAHQVALQWILHGRHIGPFLGIPPTGRQVTLTSSSIATIAENRIVSWFEILDEVGFLDQTKTRHLLAG